MPTLRDVWMSTPTWSLNSWPNPIRQQRCFHRTGVASAESLSHASIGRLSLSGGCLESTPRSQSVGPRRKCAPDVLRVATNFGSVCLGVTSTIAPISEPRPIWTFSIASIHVAQGRNILIILIRAGTVECRPGPFSQGLGCEASVQSGTRILPTSSLLELPAAQQGVSGLLAQADSSSPPIV